MHAHAAGLGYGASGCFVNRLMQRNYRSRVFFWATGLTEAEVEREGDRLVLERISAAIAQSATVDEAILLALDGVIGSDGTLDHARTQVYVPNEYLARETARFHNLRYGASINPLRRDAVARVHESADAGAQLIKWIPSIMGIELGNATHKPFYRALAERELPLLVHTGEERSFAYSDDRLNDPRLLRFPLDEGVRVVAAHIGAKGAIDRIENFDRVLALIDRYPNLFVDISSLTQLNRLGYLQRALASGEVVERMLYGSDWPLQFRALVSPWYHVGRIGPRRAATLARIENQWDRDVKLKSALGVPSSVFLRSAEFFRRVGRK